MNNLTQYRMAKGLKQSELAEKIGITKIGAEMISRFENDVCLPNSTTMERLEAILGVDRSDIFPEAEIFVAESQMEKPANPTVDTVLYFLRYGAENAVTRQELCAKTGLTDRAVREAIEIARRQGAFVMNRQDGKGYFLSNDVADLERQYKQDTNRALSILARRKSVRKRLKEIGAKV